MSGFTRITVRYPDRLPFPEASTKPDVLRRRSRSRGCLGWPGKIMDVVLVSMPFAEVQRPSIALGLLHASLAGTGIESEIVYGNFGLAERIGLVAYQAMQLAPTDHLLGEWCFAGYLFPISEAKDEEIGRA